MKRFILILAAVLLLIPVAKADKGVSFSSPDAAAMYGKLSSIKEAYAGKSPEEYAAAVRDAFGKDENGATVLDFEINIPDPINIVKLIRFGTKIGRICFPRYVKTYLYKPDLHSARPKIIFKYKFSEGKGTFHAYIDSFEIKTIDKKISLTGIPPVGGEDYTVFLPSALYNKLYTDSMEYIIFGLHNAITMLNEKYNPSDLSVAEGETPDYSISAEVVGATLAE